MAVDPSVWLLIAAAPLVVGIVLAGLAVRHWRDERRRVALAHLAGAILALAAVTALTLAALAPGPRRSVGSLPSGSPPATATQRTSAAPVDGRLLSDARLVPVIRAIRAHPDWFGKAAITSLTVTAAVPSMRELCVEVQDDDGRTLAIQVDVRGAWSIAAAVRLGGPDFVAVFEAPGHEEAGELCVFVLAGAREAFVERAEQIDVTGAIADPGQIAVLRDALFEAPERFGIDRRGRPALTVQPLPAPADALVCLDGVVYVSAPRARVVIGLRRQLAGWVVDSVRVVERALRSPGPRPATGC